MTIYSYQGDAFETSKLYLTQHSIDHNIGLSRKVKRSELKKAFRLKQGKDVSGKYSDWKKFESGLWHARLGRDNRKIVTAKIGCQIFTGENLVKLLKWVRG